MVCFLFCLRKIYIYDVQSLHLEHRLETFANISIALLSGSCSSCCHFYRVPIHFGHHFLSVCQIFMTSTWTCFFKLVVVQAHICSHFIASWNFSVRNICKSRRLAKMEMNEWILLHAALHLNGSCVLVCVCVPFLLLGKSLWHIYVWCCRCLSFFADGCAYGSTAERWNRVRGDYISIIQF